MANDGVSIQVDIIQGSIDGNSIYLENHSVLTNEKNIGCDINFDCLAGNLV